MSEPNNDDLSEIDRRVIRACATLVGQAGATHFQLGYLHDNVPAEKAGWYAEAHWQGTRLIVDDQPSPAAAASGLAQKILVGARCRCGQPVALTDRREGCHWVLAGDRWQPGCDAPPMTTTGRRGDVAAMQDAAAAAVQQAAEKGRSCGL